MFKNLIFVNDQPITKVLFYLNLLLVGVNLISYEVGQEPIHLVAATLSVISAVTCIAMPTWQTAAMLALLSLSAASAAALVGGGAAWVVAALDLIGGLGFAMRGRLIYLYRRGD